MSVSTRGHLLAIVGLVLAGCGSTVEANPALAPPPGRYIVVLAEVEPDGRDPLAPVEDPDAAYDVRALVAQLTEVYPGDVLHVYQHALRGFAAIMPADTVTALAADPRVAWVENDIRVEAFDVQEDPPWGLNRIDQQFLPLDSVYGYENDGTGVHVYVLDTGIRTRHVDFGGRAVVAFDALGGDGSDCNGHGTSVASIIGGSTFGVAKDARLHGVRVLGCDGEGWASTLVAGMDWVAGWYQSPAVANISLGGARSRTVDVVVARLLERGVVCVAAAGNNARDVQLVSPARVPGVLAVGAIDREDTRWSLSNFGDSVLFAPGVRVPAASSGHDLDARPGTGTSIAAAHVSGVVARFLELYPDDSPRQVAERGLLRNMTLDRVTDARAYSNHLLYSGFREGLLEGVEQGVLTGWVWDPSNPDRAVEVTVTARVEGQTRRLGTVLADVPREDLARRGLGRGAHGFRFALPPELRGQGRLSLSVTVSGSNYLLVDARGSDWLVVKP